MHKVDREKIFWRKVVDQTVVFNPETGFSYALDEPGGFIWDLVVAGKSFEDIAAGLAQTYGIDARVAEQDVRALLEQLHKEGLTD